MSRTVPQHKQQYQRFIDPDYTKVAAVNGWEIAKQFQHFHDECMAQIPDEPSVPKDAYMYNTHMGAFARALDEAKDHFLKGKLAYYAVRGSGEDAPKA
jgi:hypothetical protein